jgi:hypothetical protein
VRWWAIWEVELVSSLVAFKWGWSWHLLCSLVQLDLHVSLHCFVFSRSRCWLISSSCPYVMAECRGSCGCSCDVRFVVRPLRLAYFVTILFLQLLPPLSQPITFTPHHRQW